MVRHHVLVESDISFSDVSQVQVEVTAAKMMPLRSTFFHLCRCNLSLLRAETGVRFLGEEGQSTSLLEWSSGLRQGQMLQCT